MKRSLLFALCLCCFACAYQAAEAKNIGKKNAMIPSPQISSPDAAQSTEAEATFAGGCFWCIEGVFEQLNGVLDAESGYAGGKAELANYEAVCTGNSGHAEVVKVRYNPQVVSYATLLHVFFSTHNPCTLNRQGPDKGTQYRSAIFYANDAQKSAAETYIKQLTAAKAFNDPIVTSLEPLDAYFAAEAYHQDFARLHPSHGYIRQQSAPKIEKVCALFPKQVKAIIKEANAD